LSLDDAGFRFESEGSSSQTPQERDTAVMKHPNLSFTLLLFVLMASLALPGSGESSRKVTVSMRPYRDTRFVAAVKVNGAGPYDFMVDTGATVCVVDTALFHELGLRAEGTLEVVSSSGASQQTRSVVREIALDGLSVVNVAVVSMQSPMAPYSHAVRGILGENFLRHFDILIDNQHRTMTLDAGDSLAGSLSGERLPITFPLLPQGDDNRYRPTISVKLQAYGFARLLLDSGATSLALMRPRIEPIGLSDKLMLRTVNGSLQCDETMTAFYLGTATMRNVEIVTCQTGFGKSNEIEGTVPTGIFKQIFISHAGSYAIVNPTHVPAETTVAALSPQ
jgi:predicted aspartyl protease